MTLVKKCKICVQRHDFNTFMEIEFLVLNGMQHGSSRVVSENEEMKCGGHGPYTYKNATLPSTDN